MQQMTGSIVRRSLVSNRTAVAKTLRGKLLPNITDPRAEVTGVLSVCTVICKQVLIRNQHRAATTGVGDDWTISLMEGFDVFACKFSRTLKVTSVRVQRPAANLSRGLSDLAIIRFENSDGGFIHAVKQAVSHAAGKQRDFNGGFIFRDLRTLATFRNDGSTMAGRLSLRALQQQQSKLKASRNSAGNFRFDEKTRNAAIAKKAPHAKCCS